MVPPWVDTLNNAPRSEYILQAIHKYLTFNPTTLYSQLEASNTYMSIRWGYKNDSLDCPERFPRNQWKSKSVVVLPLKISCAELVKWNGHVKTNLPLYDPRNISKEPSTCLETNAHEVNQRPVEQVPFSTMPPKDEGKTRSRSHELTSDSLFRTTQRHVYVSATEVQYLRPVHGMNKRTTKICLSLKTELCQWKCTWYHVNAPVEDTNPRH